MLVRSLRWWKGTTRIILVLVSFTFLKGKPSINNFHIHCQEAVLLIDCWKLTTCWRINTNHDISTGIIVVTPSELMFLPTQWLPSTHSTQPWTRRRSWQTGYHRTATHVDSLGSGLLVPVPEWQQCEVTLRSRLDSDIKFRFIWHANFLQKTAWYDTKRDPGIQHESPHWTVWAVSGIIISHTLSVLMVHSAVILICYNFCSDVSNNNLGGSDIPYNLPPNLERL